MRRINFNYQKSIFIKIKCVVLTKVNALYFRYVSKYKIFDSEDAPYRQRSMRRICLIIRKLFLIKIIDTPYLLRQMRRMALTFRNFFLSKTDTPYLGEKMRRIELIKRVVFYKN